MTRAFVAVHVGAGFHTEAHSKELKNLCKKACEQAMESLREGASAAEAAVLAISILENSPQTNAALGSNLSLSGGVECDASVMDGQGNFGAVGAVEGVVNPIQVAYALLKESSQGCLPLGRVPPLVLVGDGACLWCKQHQLATCPPEDLITDRARAVYLDHVSRLNEVTGNSLISGSLTEVTGDGLVASEVGRPHPSHEASPHQEGAGRELGVASPHQERVGTVSSRFKDDVEIAKSPKASSRAERKHLRPDEYSETAAESCAEKKLRREGHIDLSPATVHPLLTSTASGHAPLDTIGATPCRAPLDTVGAICLDMTGEAAAGVSSGGISLKSPGRVGQATIPGCGCWADNQAAENCRAVAASTSGTGEYIIKTTLAKECAVAMLDSSLHSALDEKFLNSKRLRHVEQKLAGAIVFSLTTDNVLHFSWGHTTESMCIGFMASAHKAPTAIISKMENPERSGLTSHVQAVRINC